jgi:hypothetical protein
MNLSELKISITEDTHRTYDDSILSRFIRMAEGLIRRDLVAYPLTYTITDSDRVESGVYTLPTGVSQIRSIRLKGRQGDDLSRVAPSIIRRLDASADPYQYTVYGSTIEFRGVPSEPSEFVMQYYGVPAPLVNPTDTNDLLNDHEQLYISGASYALYLNTQDLELAQTQLDIFNGIIGTLNEQLARLLGGNVNAPTYNVGFRSSY